MLWGLDEVNQYKHVLLVLLQLFGSRKLLCCAAVPDRNTAYAQ